MTLFLNSYDKAFSRGGNRYCFIEAMDDQTFRCIKLIRPDRTPEIRRNKQNVLKRLKPLNSFNENYQEQKVYQLIDKHIGEAAYQLIPRCYGLINTDLGIGLSFELITDYDQKISQSLKQYIWENNISAPLEIAINTFKQQWQQLGMPSRNLLLHNMVVQKITENNYRIVVIDGLGWPTTMFYAYFLPRIARKKSLRKVSKLDDSIKKLIEKRDNGGEWGYHGWLEEKQRIITHD